ATKARCEELCGSARRGHSATTRGSAKLAPMHDAGTLLTDAPSSMVAVAPGSSTLAPLEFAERYAHTGNLAAGGMGQLVVAKDHQIGRSIAIKRVHARGDRSRFVREARIQGQLEHPAI